MSVVIDSKAVNIGGEAVTVTLEKRENPNGEDVYSVIKWFGGQGPITDKGGSPTPDTPSSDMFWDENEARDKYGEY